MKRGRKGKRIFCHTSCPALVCQTTQKAVGVVTGPARQHPQALYLPDGGDGGREAKEVNGPRDQESEKMKMGNKNIGGKLCLADRDGFAEPVRGSNPPTALAQTCMQVSLQMHFPSLHPIFLLQMVNSDI